MSAREVNFDGLVGLTHHYAVYPSVMKPRLNTVFSDPTQSWRQSRGF